MSNPMSLENKRILVTGASSGIGAACAQVLAELGASVILVSRRGDRLEDLRRSLPQMDNHQCLPFDLGVTSRLVDLVDSARADGKLDGLVHAAGVMPLMPIGMINQAEAKDAFELNYFSFLELMKHCTKMKVRNPGFSAVAVSSVSSEVGWAAGSVYCGTKGALSATVRSLALELAPKGIRVNAVCPSNIRTPLHRCERSGLSPEEFYQELAGNQPLGLGEPRQVANAVAFLLSEAASFITGVNLPVDGGYLAK